MTSQEVRAFLERFARAWEEQDLVTLAEGYTDDCEVVSPIFHTLKGLGQVESAYRDIFKAFASRSIHVDDIIVDAETADRAAIVWTSKAIHKGEIFGIQGTGKTIELTMALILTFRDGKIAREVRVYDFTRMLLQLGLLRARA